jgi:hypothetical protein
LQAIQAVFQVGVEPALHGARTDGQILGDGPVGPAAPGRQHDLQPVAQAAVGGGAEGVLQGAELRRRELDAYQGSVPVQNLAKSSKVRDRTPSNGF